MNDAADGRWRQVLGDADGNEIAVVVGDARWACVYVDTSSGEYGGVLLVVPRVELDRFDADEATRSRISFPSEDVAEAERLVRTVRQAFEDDERETG